MFGLDYIIFRPHNVYGERQNIADPYRNVIGIFMNQIMRGEPCTIFGSGEQTRAFTYISDVAPVVARSVGVPEARNEVFNIGADKPCSVNELAAVVQHAMGAELGVRHLEARNEVEHAFCDHEKVRKVFSVEAGVPLEAGIARMGEWARRVGARASSPFAEIEIRKNLPPSWAEQFSEKALQI